ncbi:MAG: hypothetical protein H8D43_04720 [Chloroflexi bacterium]|nr:hypothetical protein [Chloroflexota bacterium]
MSTEDKMNINERRKYLDHLDPQKKPPVRSTQVAFVLCVAHELRAC